MQKLLVVSHLFKLPVTSLTSCSVEVVMDLDAIHILLDPADDGFFELTIPDFTRDPSYESGFVDSAKAYGWLEIVLRDRTIGRPLASIVPSDAPGKELEIKREYHDPLVFTIRPPNGQ